MAVIGARPATGIGFPARRARARTRPRPAPRSAPRSGAGRRRREMTGASGLLVAIAVAAGLGLFYLSQSAHVAATGYEIDELQAQLAQLRAQQQQLILSIGEARSPAVIERRATTELHLVPLPQDHVSFARPSTKQIAKP
jgi:uncharacterized protein HemX